MDKNYSSVNFSKEFVLMVNAVPDAVILFDKSGSIVLWNKAAELILGYNVDEILGKNFIDIMNLSLNKEKAEKAALKFSEFVSEKIGLENSFFKRGIFKRKDNLEILVDLSISSGEINDGWYAICIVRDISTQVETEYEKSYLFNLVKSSNDAIIGTNLDHIIISWNAGAERIYGYEASEIIGQNISVIIPENRKNEIFLEIDNVKKGQSIKSFETERVTKSGKIVNILLSVSPIKDKFDSVVGASIISTDITREKEMFGTMIRYISEAAMRLKNPAEMVQLNLSNIIDLVKSDGINKENLILNLSLQMKNIEQIIYNLRELNQALIGSYEEIPEEYIKYFNN